MNEMTEYCKHKSLDFGPAPGHYKCIDCGADVVPEAPISRSERI